MKKSKDAETSFTAKEVLNFIQNAVLGISRFNKLPKVDESRARVLRSYTEALIFPLREHVQDEELGFSSAELVMVLLTAAQIIHTIDVMGLEKLPFDIEGIL